MCLYFQQHLFYSNFVTKCGQATNLIIIAYTMNL